MRYITLRNGVKIPQLGYGTNKVTDPQEGKKVFLDAIKAGYRHFDTAQVYKNEEIVGQAIKESGIPREEFFITTKIRFRNHNDPIPRLEQSFKNLQTDYIDLVLIHWPYGNYYNAYKVLEDYYKQGRIKAIGVSNFNPDRYMDLIHNVEIEPMVNQIEVNVYAQRLEEMPWYKKYNAIIEAYAPLGHGVSPDLFNEEILINIGKKYGKTPAQVALRYLLDRDIIIIPKSANPERIRENFNLFDFQLTTEEMKEIEKLDKRFPTVGRPADPLIVEKMYGKDE